MLIKLVKTRAFLFCWVNMGALCSHQIQHVQRIHRLHMPIGMRATMLIPVVNYMYYNVVNENKISINNSFVVNVTLGMGFRSRK